MCGISVQMGLKKVHVNYLHAKGPHKGTSETSVCRGTSGRYVWNICAARPQKIGVQKGLKKGTC